MQFVSQVSLPMRIALAATLAFTAVWLVALRPKPPASAPAPTPPTASPQSAPGQAAANAEKAVGGANDATAKREDAAGSAGAPAADTATPAPGQAAADPATKPATKPGAAAKQPVPAVDVDAASKLSKPAKAIVGDLAKGKVTVLLFWDRRLSDDRAVHTTVKGLSRRGGKVAVHVAPIRDLALYEPITRGVPVVTSPTVLVIDRAGQGRSVAGLTVPGELEELVGKALRVKP
jgi:hypothetical protein